VLTFHHGEELPHTQPPHVGELAQGGLQEEQRDATAHEEDDVGHEEGTFTRPRHKGALCQQANFGKKMMF